MIYDITRTVSVSTAVWPGDTRYQLQTNAAIADGASINLLTMTLSPHTGTHADAYFHYEKDGAHPAAMPLDAYIGRARVVSTDKRNGPLVPDDFADYDLDGGERLLVHSHISDLPDSEFPQVFPYASAELIGFLAEKGYRLLGLDSPSMDAFDSTTLPAHHALAQHDMVNLELLNLSSVPDGDYDLAALPLKLDGACGSPVRAVLRPLNR